MKHCKSCESCEIDPICLYIKDIEYRRCVIDGHHIEEPFWEKCDRYRQDYRKKDKKSSILYHIIKRIRQM